MPMRKKNLNEIKSINDKILIGLTATVTVYGNPEKKVKARIDTGATRSSIDTSLAAELHLGPIIKRKKIKSAHGSRLRPIIEVEIKLEGKKIKTEFTVADRSHMKYGILIGQNALKKHFLIDPSID